MSQALDHQFNQLSPAEQELFRIRHTAEHILTMAMKRLYGDQIIMAMGPATAEGFYFDFDVTGNLKLSENDFPKIEKEMKKIVKANLKLRQETVSPSKAAELFKDNLFKQEWIAEIQERDEKVSLYWIDDEFVDLCSGPHVESTGQVKAFKLLSIAGAYWRGDEKNKMLTRIYGTAFPSQEELKEYIWRIEEAKRRDHKKLGPELDLFTFSELVGSGLPLWTPKGTLLRNLLDDFVWQLRRQRGYHKVEIPHITKKELYETSGHWDKFKEELFKINTREGHEFAMKPMNCPHHTQIFARKAHSYREMPQRYCNTTMVYRDEQTGELSGLSRVRAITQDDAHVFCRKNQIKQEITSIWDIIDEFYQSIGFDLYVRLSLSDPEHPEKYLGSREAWISAENQLREIAHERNVPLIEAIGEAAFYGPKLDFMAKDSLGREWQVATNQLDMNMPDRFGLYCVNESGEKEPIFMIHAAIMGSIERYMSILIEHFAGAFPVWLAPVQVVVMPISQDQAVYGKLVLEKLKEAGIRAELWDQNESIGKKIRLAEKQKVPYMAVAGGKEVESESVSLRGRGDQDLGSLSLDNLLDRVKKKINSKALDL